MYLLTRSNIKVAFDFLDLILDPQCVTFARAVGRTILINRAVLEHTKETIYGGYIVHVRMD
jgi:hypothetical protein